jgi:predicted DNA-binding transcriptional regulator AlpA
MCSGLGSVERSNRMVKTPGDSEVLAARQNGRDGVVLQDDTPGPFPTLGARTTGATRMLRLAQVIERVELRKTTIYKLQKQGHFPMSVPLTGHSVRWIADPPM